MREQIILRIKLFSVLMLNFFSLMKERVALSTWNKCSEFLIFFSFISDDFCLEKWHYLLDKTAICDTFGGTICLICAYIYIYIYMHLNVSELNKRSKKKLLLNWRWLKQISEFAEIFLCVFIKILYSFQIFYHCNFILNKIYLNIKRSSF